MKFARKKNIADKFAQEKHHSKLILRSDWLRGQGRLGSGGKSAVGLEDLLSEIVADARVVAGRVGYPVMLKAAAGGGGKGVRAVRSSADLESAWRMSSVRR